MEGIKRKGNIITIDLDKVTTQTGRAKALGLHEGTVRQRISRARRNIARHKEDFFDIPELSLTLVPKP